MIQQKIDTIVKNLKVYCQDNGFNKAVVGLSGGVDSALTAKLGTMTLGSDNVFAVLMPFEGLSDPAHTHDAEAWAKEMGIAYKIVPINDFEGPYNALDWGNDDLAAMNVKARIRANILYHYANTHGAIVLGTGNKTEEEIGYFTKYGDGAVDILPIGTLYKTEVWEASKALGLPEAIINKAPTAELHVGQTDEEEIGLTYAEMDEILMKFEAGHEPETDNEKKLWQRIQNNRHKNSMPPVIPST